MRSVVHATGAVVLVLAIVAGCGGDAPSGGTAAEAGRRVVVYFVRDEKVGAAARTVADDGEPLRATLEELLAGPSTPESDAGLETAIPPGTRLRGVEVVDGVATVDVSGAFDKGGGSASMFARLAQLVFTATGTPGVEGVELRLDGEPVGVFSGEGIVLEGPQKRADFEDQSPAILVERPAVGDTVRSPLVLEGTANTFEANFEYVLSDDAGRRLAGGFVTAACGTGCRGAFSVTTEFDPGDAETATLRVFEPSPEDGRPTKEVSVPVRLG